MGEKEEPHIFRFLGLLQKTDTLSVEQKPESFLKFLFILMSYTVDILK